MADLSPAAQFVMDAYLNAPCGEPRRVWVAAALRAASAQMMDLIGDIYHPKYLEGIEASSDLLDQIATELENQP